MLSNRTLLNFAEDQSRAPSK